jgi:hypothetical protein
MISTSFRSQTSARSWSVSAMGALTLFAGLSIAGAPAAAAADARSAGIFDMDLMSSGLAVHIHDPNLVLQPDVVLGGYTALATLDNLGGDATAGAPSLGDYVGPLVGHYNGLADGQAPPSPPVAGEVHSSYPGEPSAAQRNGPYAIEATSSEHESKALANLGFVTPGSQNAALFSVAHLVSDGKGALKAVGTAGADLLNVGGVLDVGNVSSTVLMNQSGSGAAQYVTTTDVGTIVVSGQKFGLNQDGLTLAGAGAGVSPADLNSAVETLKQAGVTIRYIPADVAYVPGTKTVQSIESGAVEVGYQQDVPSQGLVTTTFTLGYVKLAATTPSGAASRVAGVADPGAFRAASFAAAAHGDRAKQGEGASVAILTPTLRMLRFGSTIGMPDGCNIVAGTLGAGAVQLGAQDAAPAVAGFVDQCATMGNAGGDQLTNLMPAVEPLDVINPAVDPGIDSFADALDSLGHEHAEAVAPFGPTIAGFGDSARFFKGCQEC